MSHAREIHPGVFLSKVQPDEWEPDPEVGGEWHVLYSGDDSYVGMTRYETDPGPVDWTPPVRESIVVLEGRARIEIEGGPTLDVSVGDMASLPGGTVTTWHLTVPYKELWIFERTYEA